MEYGGLEDGVDVALMGGVATASSPSMTTATWSERQKPAVIRGTVASPDPGKPGGEKNSRRRIVTVPDF